MNCSITYYCVILGNVHVSANIIKDQVENYKNKETDAIQAMEEVKALAYAMKDELLKGICIVSGNCLIMAGKVKNV